MIIKDKDGILYYVIERPDGTSMVQKVPGQEDSYKYSPRFFDSTAVIEPLSPLD